MVYWFSLVFAVIGATAILFALAFVSAVIGGLVNASVTLMCGPIIDRIVARCQGRKAPA